MVIQNMKKRSEPEIEKNTRHLESESVHEDLVVYETLVLRRLT